MTMLLEEVCLWLRNVEELASSTYAELAESNTISGELANFLKRIAADEALHYHLMGSAAELVRQQKNTLISAILVDSETKERIEQPFRELQKNIRQKQLTERNILEAVVTSETSEWNDIFLYVIDYCMEVSPTFQYIAATIQGHEQRIENFISKLDKHVDLSHKFHSLPKIWENQLLIVDDDESVRNLLARVLEGYGQVTLVENGELALNALRANYFNVVITDNDMPVRNGISLLQEALDDTDLKHSHFIVCTGNATEEVKTVTEKYNVPLLDKPISLKNLRELVENRLTLGSLNDVNN